MTDEEKKPEQQDLGFKENDIAEDIRAAFDEADDKAIDEEVDKLEAKDESPPEKEDESPLAEQVEEEIETTAETDEEEALEEDEEEEDLVEDEGPPILPPVSWSAEDKELFSELPRQAQEVVLRRESERDTFLTQKAKEFEQQKRDYDAIDDAIAPYEQHWDLQGVNAADAIRQSIAMRQALTQNPGAFIQWVAQQANLNLNEVAQAPTQVDPQVAQLQAQQAQLQQYLVQQQQAVQEQQREQLTQGVEHFANQTSESGQPLYPHFWQLANDMEPHIRHLRSTTQMSQDEILKTAYDRAAWGNPDVRKSLQQGSKEKSLAKKKEKVKKAKKASKSLNGSPGSTAQPETPEDLRDVIVQAWDAQAA